MKKILKQLSILALGACIVLSCNMYPKEQRLLTIEKHYFFNPTNILSSVENNNPTVIPISIEENLDIIPNQQPVKWTFNEYLNIAYSVSEMSQRDGLNNWKLKEIFLGLSCENFEYGFQQAYFSFFEERITTSGLSKFERIIGVYPLYHRIDVFEFSYQSSWFQSFDLEGIQTSKLKVSAEDTLLIAENNGGGDFRNNLNNQCGISVSLTVNSMDDKGWWVRYSNEELLKKFSIYINPFITYQIKLGR